MPNQPASPLRPNHAVLPARGSAAPPSWSIRCFELRAHTFPSESEPPPTAPSSGHTRQAFVPTHATSSPGRTPIARQSFNRAKNLQDSRHPSRQAPPADCSRRFLQTPLAASLPARETPAGSPAAPPPKRSAPAGSRPTPRPCIRSSARISSAANTGSSTTKYATQLYRSLPHSPTRRETKSPTPAQPPATRTVSLPQSQPRTRKQQQRQSKISGSAWFSRYSKHQATHHIPLIPLRKLPQLHMRHNPLR